MTMLYRNSVLKHLLNVHFSQSGALHSRA